MLLARRFASLSISFNAVYWIRRDTCKHFVPDVILSHMDSDQLLTGMLNCLKMIDANNSSPLDMKIDVCEILKKWPIFGASFYHVKVSYPTTLSLALH